MKAPAGFGGIFATDTRACSAYAEGAGIYRMVPAAVACPASTADLQLLLEWAAAEARPLVPRGAGSAVTGSSVGHGVMVDLADMPRVLEIDSGRKRARVSANVTCAQLNSAARSHGLRLPPEPSSQAFATVGGMVATNAAGSRSAAFGPVRQWVRALELCLADGSRARMSRGTQPENSAILDRLSRWWNEQCVPRADSIVSRYPKTRKNTAGYALDQALSSGDLVDLFIGSEGTLAFFDTIELELAPEPRRRMGLSVTLVSLDSLAAVCTALREHGAVAVELLDSTFLSVLPDRRSGEEAVLLVEFEGDDEVELEIELAAAAAAVSACGAGEVVTAITAEESDELWRLRHAASPILAGLPESRRSLQVVEDGCVPPSRLGEYLTAVRAAGERSGVPLVIFGHAADGHLHVNLLPDIREPDWLKRVEQVRHDVTSTLLRLAGTPSGEHGDGRIRPDLLGRLYGKEIVGLFRQLKDICDPTGILNPGVLLPNGAEPFGHLKVGRSAAELPGDIAAGLREIERSGGYALRRLELAQGGRQ